MAFRVQPPSLEIPKDDPFANDKLARKEPAEILTRLVRTFDGPCVIAVDAGWGNGKTTFLKMWAQYLRNEGCPTVEFNAWETDFAVNPFLALTEEIIEERAAYDELSDAAIEKFRSVTVKVLRQMGLEFAQIAAASLAGPVVGKALGSLLDDFAQEKLSEYAESKKAIRDFKATLNDVADALQNEDEEYTPLVVVIDELDRCRPTYAIELLETAKHLFSVDGVVFALGINRASLEHSISALYGESFDGAEYLRRFFDIDFRLPEAERAAFIDAKLAEIQVDVYYRPDQIVLNSSGRGDASQLLHDFFGSPDLSLRTVGQALHRLGLILTSSPDDRMFSALTATFAIILRTSEPDLYYRLAHNEATDEEVAVTLFARMAPEYRYSHIGRNLEREILMAAAEKQAVRGVRLDKTDSPLLLKYRELSEKNKSSGVESDPETDHAIAMLSIAEHDSRYGYTGGSRATFRYIYERLELLSKDFLDG